MLYYIRRVRRWCSWLRHCYTRGNVTGSKPDGVLGIIFIHIIMVSNKPLTEMRFKKISWIEKRPERRADNLTTTCRLS